MKKKLLNIKSNSGFTMADLVVALSIFVIFTGIIGSLFYSAYKINMQVKMSGNAMYYAMQILEDIDKIPYDQVTNGMEESYISKYSITSGFSLEIDVSNYNEGNSKEDLIKKVKLTITYDLAGNTEEIVVNRLKVKEI